MSHGVHGRCDIPPTHCSLGATVSAGQPGAKKSSGPANQLSGRPAPISPRRRGRARTRWRTREPPCGRADRPGRAPSAWGSGSGRGCRRARGRERARRRSTRPSDQHGAHRCEVLVVDSPRGAQGLRRVQDAVGGDDPRSFAALIPEIDEWRPCQRRVAARAHDADGGRDPSRGSPTAARGPPAATDAQDLRPESCDGDVDRPDRHLEAASARFVERPAGTHPSQQRDQLIDALGRVRWSTRAAPPSSDPPAAMPRSTRSPYRSCTVASAAAVWKGWRRNGLVTIGPTAIARSLRAGRRLGARCRATRTHRAPRASRRPWPRSARQLRGLVESRIEQVAGHADLPRLCLSRSYLRVTVANASAAPSMSRAHVAASRAKPTLSGPIRRACAASTRPTEAGVPCTRTWSSRSSVISALASRRRPPRRALEASLSSSNDSPARSRSASGPLRNVWISVGRLCSTASSSKHASPIVYCDGTHRSRPSEPARRRAMARHRRRTRRPWPRKRNG